MFGNQNEINKQITSHMMINLVGSNYLHESIVSNCLELIDGDYSGRIRVISLLNTDQLLYKNNKQLKDSFGLLNMTWIKKTTTQRPATVVLVYDTRNKPEGISWKDFENSIFIDINKAKKMDNYQFVNLVVVIFCNTSSFTFDNVSEDGQRSYNIKKMVDPKNIFYIAGTDGLKNISKKLSSHLIKITLNYYRTLKKNLKIKKNNSNELREKLIKYNTKLGVISQIKNKKRSWKYFEEAYNQLSTLEPKSYFFGTQNVKLNYYEIKAVADWLFFKIFYSKIATGDINNNQSILTTFNFHINTFSKMDYYAGSENFKCDRMIIIELFWRYSRYEFIAKFLEENEKIDFYVKHFTNFPGYNYLLSAYNIARIIKYLNLFGIENLTNLSSNIKFENMKYRENKFYGKAPKLYEQIDPLTEKDYEYDENFYLKTFISFNNINYDFLYSKLTEYLNRSDRLYSTYLIQSKENSKGVTSMTIFFNILAILYNDSYSKYPEKLKILYKNFISCPNLNKFPLLYLKYLQEYNQILLNENSIENAGTIFNNLCLIANFKNLTQVEEEIFFNIIQDQSEEIKQKQILQKNSKIISFDFSVTNNTPKIFEIIEYQLNFKTELNLRSLKIKTINLIFNNQERNKAFFENQFELSKDSQINLSYKILIKDSDKNLKLKSVRFELLTNTEQSIYLEILVKYDKDKTINIKDSSLNVLEFKYPKNISVGVGQYYNFECQIFKNDDSLEVENLILDFIINDDEIQNITRSTVNVSKHKHSKSTLSSTITNFPIEEVNVQHTMDESNLNTLYKKDITLSLVEHEIISKNQDGSITHHKNWIQKKLNKIENHTPITCKFLIKFNDPGNFFIKFDADYKIMKKEIHDDTSSLRFSGKVNIDVKPSFNIKHDFYSETYMSLHMQKIYSIDKLIKLNMIIFNNLDYECELKEIQTFSQTELIHLDSPLSNVLAAIPDVNFIIQKGCEFLIPFSFKTNNQYSGCLGKFKIIWRDEGLKSFDDSIFNTTELILPDVNIKNFDVALEYKVPQCISTKQEIELKINVINNTNEFKKLVFLIDTSANYVTSGQVKKKLLLYPNEIKELILPLIPIYYGRLKLPLFKIMEFPLASTNYENKIYSVYMVPEFVLVNGI